MCASPRSQPHAARSLHPARPFPYRLRPLGPYVCSARALQRARLSCPCELLALLVRRSRGRPLRHFVRCSPSGLDQVASTYVTLPVAPLPSLALPSLPSPSFPYRPFPPSSSPRRIPPPRPSPSPSPASRPVPSRPIPSLPSQSIPSRSSHPPPLPPLPILAKAVARAMVESGCGIGDESRGEICVGGGGESLCDSGVESSGEIGGGSGGGGRRSKTEENIGTRMKSEEG